MIKMATVEYYPVEMEAIDLGKVDVHLLRSTLPLTIQTLYKRLANKFVAGRAHWVDFTKKDAFYFDVQAKRGKEGQATELKKNEIGYSYPIDSIIVVLSDNAEIPYYVVKIGEIIGDASVLKDLKNGTSIKMKLKK